MCAAAEYKPACGQNTHWKQTTCNSCRHEHLIRLISDSACHTKRILLATKLSPRNTTPPSTRVQFCGRDYSPDQSPSMSVLNGGEKLLCQHLSCVKTLNLALQFCDMRTHRQHTSQSRNPEHPVTFRARTSKMVSGRLVFREGECFFVVIVVCCCCSWWWW